MFSRLFDASPRTQRVFSHLFSRQLAQARSAGYDECNKQRQEQVNNLLLHLRETEERLSAAYTQLDKAMLRQAFLNALSNSAVLYPEHGNAARFADEAFNTIANYWYVEGEEQDRAEEQKLRQESLAQSAGWVAGPKGRVG